MRLLALSAALLLPSPAAAASCPPRWIESHLGAYCARQETREERLKCLELGERACVEDARASRARLRTAPDENARAEEHARARALEGNLQRLAAEASAHGGELSPYAREELSALSGAIRAFERPGDGAAAAVEASAAPRLAAAPFSRARRRGPEDDSAPRLPLGAAVLVAAVFALFVGAAMLWWGPDETGEGVPEYGRPPRPGQTVAGKWTLRRRVEGPGVPVYEARDRATGAARIVRGPMPVPVTDMIRAVEAAVAAGKLTHPALSDLYEPGRDIRGVFVATESLEGQTLEAALARGGALEAGFARRVAAATAEALSRLHEAGLVHGGFAPRWVLLRPDGSLKLRGLGPCPDPSPEPLREPGERPPDAATDQYAWAATVYHMLAGAPPFGGADGPELKLREDGCPSPARHRAGLPPALDGYFRVALAPDPERRFDSVKSAAEAFAACWPLPATKG
jgi:hypothetical protein